MRESLGSYPLEQIFWPLQMMLIQLGIEHAQRVQLESQIATVVHDTEGEPEAVQEIYKLLQRSGTVIRPSLHDRTEVFVGHLTPYMIGHKGQKVLDFGCGDAEIMLRLSERLGPFGQTVLYDVSDYRIHEATQASGFQFTTDWEEVIKAAPFDVAVASTVLHHCDDPIAEIDRLLQVAQKVVIIESVINQYIPWHVQAFINWFYNRCLHNGAEIPVPGNFFRKYEWIETFQASGTTLVAQETLGIDLPLVPEYHELLVFEKNI